MEACRESLIIQVEQDSFRSTTFEQLSRERKPRTSPAYARDMRIHDLYLRYSTDYDDLPPYFRAVATELLCLAMLPCCTSCSLERAQLEMLLPRLHLNRRALRDGSDATAGGEEDWVPTT